MEKLAEIFLNTFHQDKTFEKKDEVYSYRDKLGLKTFQLELSSILLDVDMANRREG